MKKRLLFYFITLSCTSFFGLLQFFDPDIIREKLESRTYDLRLPLKNLLEQPPPSPDIVIVSVDEKSITEVGRWPWKRDVIAGLVDKISEGKPRALGIDIMFTEKETIETDRKLAEAITKAGNVVLATAFVVPKKKGKVTAAKDVPDFLWDSAFMQVKSTGGIGWKQWAVTPESVMPPLPELAAGASLGHVYSLPDRDGVLRWQFLYLHYGNDCYPQFALQVARIALGIDPKDMVLYGGTGIQLGDRYIPVDISGRVIINYRGPEQSFPYISASDIINGSTAPGTFRHKIVLVGTSALSTYDLRVTPFSANMPGIEIDANIIDNILMNNFIRKSPRFLELIVIVLTGILLGLALPKLKALASTSLAFGLILSYIILCCYLLVYHNIWADLLYPVINMFSIFSIQTITRFFHEEKKAREIRRIFTSYVSPKIVKELVENPEKAKLGGERREITVLFSDIKGFTSLSEQRQPEEVILLLNEYFKEMVDIILKWDGTLDKFVGDLIMAIWSSPLEQPNHAELAVRCALEMSHRLSEMQEAWRNKGSDIIDAGIGINSGEVLIGNIGAPGKKMDYTAIGDHVNLTARVEKLTRHYGVKILVTENTVKKIIPDGNCGNCDLQFREVATVKVKGKEKEVKLFELMRTDGLMKEDFQGRKNE